MKLQISFDIPDLERALLIAQQVEPYCDHIEIGTSMLYKFGAQAVREFRRVLPHKTLLADTKIIDRSAEIIETIAQAGADWLTIMGGTHKQVLYTAARAAEKNKVQLMIDLIDASSPGQTAMDAHALGAHAILMHKPHDESDPQAMLDQWDLVRGNTDLPVFIAAGIDRTTVPSILKLKSDGIVVGSAITMANDPEAQAQYFYELCHQ
jgi:3-hexulose-6-phosphate synthase